MVSAAISLFLLSRALRAIPIGTGYAVWTGIGAAGTVAVGMLVLGEPRTVGRLACIVLILAGVVGLRLVGAK
jgi:quaternary ammonium compound-resistance protein SugE